MRSPKPISSLTALGALGLALGLAGCSKPAAKAVVLTAEQVPAQIEKTFAGSEGATLEERQIVVRAYEQSRPEDALGGLQRLSERPELTPEQRRVAAAALNATLEKLRAAAAAGSRKAQDALEDYRATK